MSQCQQALGRLPAPWVEYPKEPAAPAGVPADVVAEAERAAKGG